MDYNIYDQKLIHPIKGWYILESWLIEKLAIGAHPSRTECPVALGHQDTSIVSITIPSLHSNVKPVW